MIAKVHTTNDLADDIEDIFVWGEDFEAILATLLLTMERLKSQFL